MQVNSLPEINILDIVSDIHLDNHLLIKNGTIFRNAESATIDCETIKPGLTEVMSKLENKVYEFLIFDNKCPYLFNGQPLVFIVNPLINRSTVPFHRHLNNGYFRVYSNKYDPTMKNSFDFLNESNVYNYHVQNYQVIPESVCYIHNVSELDVYGYSRLEVAYATMVVYAFRNEIFLKYYELYNEFFWLGPQTPFPEFFEGHLLAVPQDGKCHCGSGEKYRSCHFESDFIKYYYRHKNRITDKDITKKMTIETQKHFERKSNETLKEIVELIELTNKSDSK